MAKEGITFGDLDGSDVRVGIIKTRWNDEVVGKLSEGVKEALKTCKVEESNVFETEVPGAFELPLAARFLALSQTVDAIVCLGCLVKGDTMHFEYIADATAKGIMDVGIMTSTPVIFGVLTCLDENQAMSRATGDNNHGVGWGMTAVEMALLRMSATGTMKRGQGSQEIGFSKIIGGTAEKKSGTKVKKPSIGF
ncbi:unnamed protein product [Discosporangium mesarthrocarpum]